MKMKYSLFIRNLTFEINETTFSDRFFFKMFMPFNSFVNLEYSICYDFFRKYTITKKYPPSIDYDVGNNYNIFSVAII